MKKYLKKHWFELVSALLLVTVASIGISAVLGYCFSTNDDAMLRNIVNGTYTGTPEAHLVYIMYPLSWIWKCLYLMLPTMPWYDIFMVGMHYVCWFMLLFRLGQQFRGNIAKLVSQVLGMGTLIIIDFPYLVMHQYTVLAALLAVVAIFWLATGKAESKKEYWADRIICIIFLTLCLWLRKQVFFMALPIGFFVLVLEFASAHKIKKKCLDVIKRPAVFLGSIVIIVAISFVVEKVAYSSPEWKDFQVYNEARTDIYDFYGIPSYDTYASEYEALDLNYGDWLVIDHYDGGLVQELDSEKLSGVAELSKQNWLEIQKYYNVFLQNLYSVCKIVLYNDVQPIGIILTILYVVSLWSCYKKEDKAGALCVCGMLAFQAAFVGYFIWQQRFPEHVSYGLYLMQFALLAAMMLNHKQEIKKDKNKRFWCVLAVLLCMVIMGAMGVYRARTTMAEYKEIVARAEDWNFVNAYFKQDADAKYCIVTKSFVFSTEEMFGNESIESDNMIRLGTWVQNSPLESVRNANSEITNVAEQLAEDENFYIVQAAENDLEWLNTFFAESGYDVQAEVSDTIYTPGGRSFHVISMR